METPELDVERGFYQRDINSVCNASARLPLRSLRGTGCEIGAPYQMLHNWGLLYRNLCSSQQVQLCHFTFVSLTFMLLSTEITSNQFVILFANSIEHATTMR